MKNFSINTLLISAGLLSALAVMPSISAAQSKTDAYLVDGRGVLARSGTGLCWRTGYWTPAQAIEECDPELVKKPEVKKPEPVAAAPTPPKPAAPMMAPEKVTFNAETLFDFDKAVLKPEGKKALDDFAAKAKGVKFEVIVAVGHADRIGTEKYNMALSKRRAAAVKDYLVKNHGFDQSAVFTDGKGESDPVTKVEDCKGKKGKALKACYQPDRRVELEVAGTREPAAAK